MYDELFEEGMPIKRELRLLAKTLRNTTLTTALEYIDKLEVKVVKMPPPFSGLSKHYRRGN